MLVAAVANCLSASLLFSLRKFKNTPGTLVAHAQAELGRNDEGRLRVGRIGVTLELPEAQRRSTTSWSGCCNSSSSSAL